MNRSEHIVHKEVKLEVWTLEIGW